VPYLRQRDPAKGGGVKALLWLILIVGAWFLAFLAFLHAPIAVAKVVFVVAVLGFVASLLVLLLAWAERLKAWRNRRRINRHARGRGGMLHNQGRVVR
jgi:fatty acid desaturase